MDYKKLDIFSPMILVVLVLVYLIFAYVGFSFNLKNLTGVGFNTVLVIFLGLVFYVLGVYIVKGLLKNREITIDKSKIKKLTSEKFIVMVVLLGIILQVVNLLYLGGIPLFSGYLKAKAATRIWLLSYLLFLPSINILLAKYPKKKYFLLFIVGLVLFTFTGYRTTVMAIVISIFICLYYTRDLKWTQLIISAAAIFALLLIVGYVAVKSIEWQTWTLNPLELLFYRAGYTLQVLDHAVALQGSTHGLLLYNTLTGFLKSTDPRVIVGSTTLGYAHSTTSMIFGPALLDFGAYAMIIQMLLLGIILGILYHLMKNTKDNLFVALYAMILAHTLIWIETGPTDLVVLLFFAIAIILCLYTTKITKKRG
ncbi:MAG: oligosaccharide repeat unit polymerase family protein [Methanosphaera sp.]|uniref:oligosaccharide repeat unit polymerase family protein n=1 Tax=Methanosphaera sp. TaxID=2666342 RepID=UPI0025EBE6BC|nr:oligosaccharide repeat unit polymerase family protein [Methanosphaera sp.]MCI5867598.1 oligosaccharide repeat unit polymerase family protein [Methanosphaera sp.]MDD6534065.1 oligosaccharide repeat unit polymerase family protein [Methanosphaera sp.]MDY3956125.1 oligosaccharide repeat unit polymerase family protein [Methanosphaera sp.]